MNIDWDNITYQEASEKLDKSFIFLEDRLLIKLTDNLKSFFDYYGIKNEADYMEKFDRDDLRNFAIPIITYFDTNNNTDSYIYEPYRTVVFDSLKNDGNAILDYDLYFQEEYIKELLNANVSLKNIFDKIESEFCAENTAKSYFGRPNQDIITSLLKDKEICLAREDKTLELRETLKGIALNLNEAKNALDSKVRSRELSYEEKLFEEALVNVESCKHYCVSLDFKRTIINSQIHPNAYKIYPEDNFRRTDKLDSIYLEPYPVHFIAEEFRTDYEVCSYITYKGKEYFIGASITEFMNLIMEQDYGSITYNIDKYIIEQDFFVETGVINVYDKELGEHIYSGYYSDDNCPKIVKDALDDYYSNKITINANGDLLTDSQHKKEYRYKLKTNKK